MKNLIKIFKTLFINDELPVKKKYKKRNLDIDSAEQIALEKLCKKAEKEYYKLHKEIISVSLCIKMVKKIKYKNKEYYYFKTEFGTFGGSNKDGNYHGELNSKYCQNLKCLVGIENGKYIYVDNKILKSIKE